MTNDLDWINMAEESPFAASYEHSNTPSTTINFLGTLATLLSRE
jgi:hypothetical protein